VTDTKPMRVVLAKPGLDGHDVGAKIVCRALRDAGMEVIYTGLRQSPKAIARAVMQENADVLGLSILSGAHIPLCEQVAEELRKVGATGITWIVGGCVPKRDQEALHELGVTRVFSTGSNLDAIVEFLRTAVAP